MCKKNSRENQDPFVKQGYIYTRTIEANGTISSAPASQNDLEEITKRCFDNRVADIGQFLRNHLTDENLRILKEASEATIENSRADDQDKIEHFAESSAEEFKQYLNEIEGAK